MTPRTPHPQILQLSSRVMGLTNSKMPAIGIPPVKVYDIETSPEKRTRTLKHLIRANHVSHSTVSQRLKGYNDLPLVC
jgi:hypothetical protein